MQNGFAFIIVVLFAAAAGFDFFQGLPARGFFYLCSAAINVAVLFLK